MFDFDPRDSADARDRDREDIYDPRWGDDPRARDERERDARDRDPRDPFVDGLDLPRGLERELVPNKRVCDSADDVNREAIAERTSTFGTRSG